MQAAWEYSSRPCTCAHLPKSLWLPQASGLLRGSPSLFFPATNDLSVPPITPANREGPRRESQLPLKLRRDSSVSSFIFSRLM